MPEKKFVCPVDKRRFATQKALSQHRSTSHGGTQGSSSGPKARKGAASQSTARPASVSMPAQVRGMSTDMAKMTGVDRLANITLTSATKSQTSLFAQLITPASFKRLSGAARSYQRIRYVKLDFTIQPQMSTATSGGYVAAFVPDPADTVSDINALTAQRGSVTTKWWESSLVRGTTPNRLLYTSSSKEVREYSPGSFVLWTDGSPTQSGNVTIFAHWSVELSQASYEETKSESVEYRARGDFKAIAGQVNLSCGGSTKPGDLFNPTPSVGSYLSPATKFSVLLKDSTGAVLKTVNWLYVATATSVELRFASKSETANTIGFSNDDVPVLAGSIFHLDTTSTTVQGECMAPPSSVSQTEMVASSLQQNPLAEQLLSLLQSLAVAQQSSLKK